MIHRTTLKSFSTCATLKCIPVPSVQLQFLVYGHMQTDRQTYTRVLQCSHAGVGLAQARPNNAQARGSSRHPI